MPVFKEIALDDIDPKLFVEISVNDPDFWKKVTHVASESHWTKEDGVDTYHTHFRYFYELTELYGRLDGGNGYVYVLENPTQPSVCKIGSTERSPGERLKEINSSPGVIFPWRASVVFRCKAPRAVEKIVHRELDAVRIRSNKEGFAVSREEAELVIQRVIDANESEFKIKN